MTSEFALALRGAAESAGLARRAIAANDPTLPPSVQDDVSLLATELVTNAVRHGDARNDRTLHVKFRRTDGIRVEVADPGTDLEPSPTPSNGDSCGGWALFLVDRVTERWGVCPTRAGRCVWFELPAGLTC
jgi:signal transduction histidine kinase